MMHFESSAVYLQALGSDPSLAIVPIQMVADVRGVTRAAVEHMLRQGKPEEIRIAGTRYVRAADVVALVENQDLRKATIRRHLEQLARGRTTTTYEPVMQSVGLTHRSPGDRVTIGKLLDEVSKETWREKKVLLSVLVRQKLPPFQPGSGFFNLATEHGLAPDKSGIDSWDEIVTWETGRVWDSYAPRQPLS